MHGIYDDARHVIRSWTRTPVVLGAALTSLALGVATVSVVFGLGSTMLLREIPGTRTPDLVRVQGSGGDDASLVVSFPEFEAIGASGAFSALTAERVNTMRLEVDGNSLSVGGAVVPAGYFDVLDVAMLRGSGFVAEDRGEGVVISEALWGSAFAYDPDVVGRGLSIGGTSFVVAGVASAPFVGAYPGFRVSLWVLLDRLDVVLPGDGSLSVVDDRFLNVLGMVDPGLAAEAVEERLDAVAAGLASQTGYPEGRTFRLHDAAGLHPSLRPIASVLLAGTLLVSLLVLAVACANVATLLLARGMAQRADSALRAALGATRLRLIRARIVESMLLGLAGGAAGIATATWVLAVLARVQPPVDVPLGLDLRLDHRAAALAAGTSLVSAIAVGMVPAVRGTRRLEPQLRAGAVDGSARWTTGLLVGAQIAGASVLLVGAVLLVRSLSAAATMDPGFDRDEVITVEVELTGWDEVRARAYRQTALELARSTPGVEAAAPGLFVHLGDRSDRLRVRAADTAGEEWLLDPVHYSIVGSGYFETLGIGLVTGSDFPSDPGSRGLAPVVVNEVLAQRLWPDLDPIGRRVELEERGGAISALEVIGVAETVAYRSLGEDPTPFMYLPYARYFRPDMLLHVRKAGSITSEELRRRLRERMSVLAPTMPVLVRPMRDHHRVETVLAGALRWLLMATGAMALSMAALGVFGVVAHACQRRLPEIGVRLTLGASPKRVRALVVGETLAIALAGVVVGLLLARPATAVLRGLLQGAAPGDPTTFASVGMLVLLVAAGAAWLPARRATRRVDIVEVLRP